MATRKGARRRADIPPAILEQLNQGSAQSASLVEALAVDFAVLLGHVAPTLPRAEVQRVEDARQLGITRRMVLLASVLTENLDRDVVVDLRRHASDTVRGWAAYTIGNDREASLSTKLDAIRPLADDAHFCVREWAWLALRDAIASDIHDAVHRLEPWTLAHSANLRRFAIESTRPRGVWARHIAELKAQPEIGRPLLDAVMQDDARYVRDSCANWLNDAAKSRPDWVREYCEGWQARASSPAVAYIVRRGLRSLD